MPNWIANRLIIEGTNPERIVRNHFKSTNSSDNETSEETFDFNTIIPMPKELNIDRTALRDEGLALYIAKINPQISEIGKSEDKILPKENFYEEIEKAFRGDYSKNIKYILKNDDIKELIKKYEKCLDDIILSGEKSFKNLQKYGYMDWYDWSNENWGTSRNASDSDYYNGSYKKSIIYFNTAWNPAIPIVQKLAELYPDLKFTYEFAEQQVACYTGRYIYENGDLISSTEFQDKSKEAFEIFFELWGEDDGYVFDKKQNTYISREDANIEDDNKSSNSISLALTRCCICIENSDGTYSGVFGMFNGDLSYTGAILLDKYNEREKVNGLILKGDFAQLNMENIGFLKQLNFDKQPKIIDLEEINDLDTDIPFCYIYGLDNKWKYFESMGLDNGLIDLKDGLDNLYKKIGLERPKNYYGLLTTKDIEKLKAKQNLKKQSEM